MDIAQETIKSIVNKASNGEINIPMFQRKFQWKATQVRDLAESLYKKYPIGVILFGKPIVRSLLKPPKNQIHIGLWMDNKEFLLFAYYLGRNHIGGPQLKIGKIK